jgi:hypothetical protein
MMEKENAVTGRINSEAEPISKDNGIKISLAEVIRIILSVPKGCDCLSITKTALVDLV